MKIQQEITDVANHIPTPEAVKEGILDTSFAAYDDNNGQGDFAITYGKEGKVNNIVVSNITEPQALDIDHNSTNEFIITYSLDFPEYSHAPTLSWDDVYEFDINKEEFVLASANYPDYYKNTYIPALNQRIAASSDSLEQQSLSVLMQAAEGNRSKGIKQSTADRYKRSFILYSWHNAWHEYKRGYFRFG